MASHHHRGQASAAAGGSALATRSWSCPVSKPPDLVWTQGSGGVGVGGWMRVWVDESRAGQKMSRQGQTERGKAKQGKARQHGCHGQTDRHTAVRSNRCLALSQRMCVQIDSLNAPGALAAHVCVHVVAWCSRCVCVCVQIDSLNEPDALAAHVCVQIVSWRSRCACVRSNHQRNSRCVCVRSNRE